MSQLTSLVLAIFAIALFGIVVWSWISTGRRIWLQRERNAFADKLARDEAPPKGPFAVYLRAFRHPAYVAIDLDFGEQLKTLIVDRHTNTDGRSGTRPLETILAELLDKDMPLVGLGRPHDGLKKSGAGLVRTTDAEWKDIVSSLLDRCSVIVMTPAGTAGTAWEIEQLGVRPEWREKTIYFMPNYQVELIRAMQPFVVGYESMFGTSRFVEKKDKPKKPGSVIVYGLSIVAFAIPKLLVAFARCFVDLAFGFVLLFQRFAQSTGLRSRWAAARRAGRSHGLAFPKYSKKGRIFVLNEQGKPHNLATLHDLSRDGLKRDILKFGHDIEKKRERLARVALNAPVNAASAPPAPQEIAGEAPAPVALQEVDSETAPAAKQDLAIGPVVSGAPHEAIGNGAASIEPAIAPFSTDAIFGETPSPEQRPA